MSTFNHVYTIFRLFAIVALVILVAPAAHAATISAGSADNTFSYYIDNVADAQPLIDTTGANALAFFSSGVESINGSAMNPSAVGVDGTVVYHFQADTGFTIANAIVTSSVYISKDSGSSMAYSSVTASYSIDNITYYDFDATVYTSNPTTSFDPINLGNLASDPFTGNTDLYLKYVLTRDKNKSHPVYRDLTQLFRSANSGNHDAPGFVVDLNLEPVPATPVPEPASLALSLLGVGSLLMVSRRRRHSAH